jgi:general secretion pathway protein N
LGIDKASRDVTRQALPPPDVTKPREAAASANPLWVVPLAALWATRDRPLFAPSRRPPVPILANAPAPAPSQVSAPPSTPPKRLNLSLVGTVSAENKGVAVFIDPSTHDAVRLRTGEGHLGWILQSVDRRTATLQKSDQRETLQLPQPTNLSGPLPVVSTLLPVVDQHRGCPQELFGCRMHTE